MDKNEIGNPHLVLPVTREQGDITLNVKTILFALALFAGGGIGGGGLSFVAAARTETVPRETVEELKQQINQIQVQLVEMNKVILNVAGDLKNDAIIHGTMSDTLRDHESRLRALEHRR